MSQFKVGGVYIRNATTPPHHNAHLVQHFTLGSIYEIDRINGIRILVADDTGREISFDHATFNEMFSVARVEVEPDPVVLPHVTPEEFMKVMQRLTELEARVETLTEELSDAWSEIRDHRRDLRHLGA